MSDDIAALARKLTDEQWSAVFRSLVEGGGADGMGHISWHQAKTLLAYVQELAQSSLIAAAIRSPRGCSWQAFECADRFSCIEHDGTFTMVGRRRDKHANWIPTPLGRAVLRVLEGDR